MMNTTKLETRALVMLGQKIRSLREQKGLAQEDLAFSIGVGRTYYGNIERGKINPGFLSLLKIARGLNVEPTQLIPSVKNIIKK